MGEQVLFWLVAPLAVLGALGLVLSRRAVHAALSIAVTMIGLAVLYIAQEAPFLGVVQVVVYTGAILMLFLFVIMLVGVDATDSLVETIQGQRAAAMLAGLGLGALLVGVVSRTLMPEPAGMQGAAPEGNVPAIADAIFGRYVWTFEVLAALLITAALSAVVLTHRERLSRQPTQRELSEQRFRSGSGAAASQLPSPGVYARHNAVDTPALLPDGSPSEQSVSNVLVARGVVRTAEDDAADVPRLERQVDELTGDEWSHSADERGAEDARDERAADERAADERAGDERHTEDDGPAGEDGGER